MKRIWPATLLALPLAVAAQHPPSQADRQRMRAQAEKAQACMRGVDMQAMQRLGKKAEQVDQEVGRLCAQGKRDEAQARALELAREMMADANFQKMQECSKLMPAEMGGGFQMPSIAEMERHQVCDERSQRK